jgi:hypothetical protein
LIIILEIKSIKKRAILAVEEEQLLQSDHGEEQAIENKNNQVDTDETLEERVDNQVKECAYFNMIILI